MYLNKLKLNNYLLGTLDLSVKLKVISIETS